MWGLVQQFLVLAVVASNLERLDGLRGRPALLVLVVSAGFGLVHALNFRLVAATFLLELLIVPLYLKHRNLWPLAVLHGLGTGSDSMNGWSQVIYVACAAVVIAACWWRIAVGWPAHIRPRVAALVASVLIPLLVLAWALTGPLQHGWASRADAPSVSIEQGAP